MKFVKLIVVMCDYIDKIKQFNIVTFVKYKLLIFSTLYVDVFFT